MGEVTWCGAKGPGIREGLDGKGFVPHSLGQVVSLDPHKAVWDSGYPHTTD